MTDYVSRQAVIDYLMINMNWYDADDRMVDDWSEKLPIITDLINGVPSAIESSEWLEDSDPGQEYGTTWACRKCGKSKHEPFIWNPYECKLRFCPWCGRRMVRELKEGENAKAD